MKRTYYAALCPLFFLTFQLQAQLNFSPPIHIDSVQFTEYANQYMIDIDKDGDDDILTLLEGSESQVVWIEQNASHRFEQQHLVSKSPSINQAGNIFPIDMDHDGDDDIVEIRNDGTDNLLWHENDGAGNFINQHIIKTIPVQCKRVVADDLDNDGDIDFILSNNSTYRQIFWIQNLGNGNYKDAQDLISTAQYIYDFQVAQLDGNASHEIVYRTKISVTGWDELYLHCARRAADGTYSIDQLIADSLTQEQLLLIRDMDMDDISDLITSKAYPDGTITWFKNDGTAQFSTEKYLPGTSIYYTFQAADFDHDGDEDVVGIGSYLGDVVTKLDIFYNDGAGGFANPKEETIYIEGGIGHVYTSDWNDDQIPDLLCTNANNIIRLENDGAGNFDPGTPSTKGKFNIYKLVTFDIDHDGKKDLVNSDGEQVAWYRNLGNHAYAALERLIPGYGYSENTWVDLDQDGDIDLLKTNYTTLDWHANDGAGHFGAATTVFNTYPANRIKTADIDSDGDLDIVFSAINILGYPIIGVLKNDGTETFTLSQSISLGSDNINTLYLGDLNGDQYMDIYTCGNSKKFFWYKNNGVGNFGSQQIISNYVAVEAYIAADIDTDGDLDLIAGRNIPTKEIVIYKNNGSGTFAAPEIQNVLPSNFNMNGFSIGDMDQDGAPDILLQGSGQRLTYVKNDGTGHLLPAAFIETEKYWSPVLADLDSDNDLDILTTSYYPESIQWLENLSITGTNNPVTGQALVSLTPNPAARETQLKIQCDLPQNQYLIELRDLNGKTLNTYKTNESDFILQRNNLPAGMYIVRIREAQSGKLLGVTPLIWN